MKAVKLLFAALAMSFAMNASAEGGRWTFDVKFGSVERPYFDWDTGFEWSDRSAGFGLGVGYQKDIKEFNNWTLAWDVVSFDYAAPFSSPAKADYLALRTGLRLFTPTFWGDKCRCYVNAAPGYSCLLWKEVEQQYWGNGILLGVDESMKAHHGFGLSVGVGFQFMEKYSIGYTLQYETAGKTKSHFATLGWSF